MGRTGSGVEVREHSIRLAFTFEGQPLRRTIYIAGKVAPPTAANVKYAHRLAAEIRERIRHGTFSLAEYFPASGAPAGGVTVAQQLDTWLGAQRLAASTLIDYRNIVRFWRGELGDRLVRLLKPSEVLTAIASRPMLSGKTINNRVSVLREALALAVADGIVSENVAAAVPRAAYQKPPVDPFTREEAEAIIAAEPEGQVRNIVEFRFFAGLRTSELAGLRWPSVDLVSGYVTIEEAMVRGIDKPSTKTDEARQVLLNSRAAAALQRQRQHTQVAGQHVFLDPRYGTPWHDERAFRRSYWNPVLKRLGIRQRRPYNTRHSCATMMLMAGMRPAFCARQLGHSVEVFFRTYSKWIDGEQDAREMALLETVLRKEGT